MGLLDRLFRGRRTSAEAPPRPVTGPEAIARWKYLLVTAPPEALATAHSDGLAALGADARAEVLRRMRTALSALEPGAVIPTDAPVLARAAARAERRSPGFLERALSTDPGGERALTGLASAVVVTVAAAPFLRGFEPGLGAEALADRRAPDFEALEEANEVPASAGAGHDDELDDED
jgi:hypothetical protein